MDRSMGSSSVPTVDQEVGSGSHAVQTAEIMKRFEPVPMKEGPDAFVVVGDVNSIREEGKQARSFEPALMPQHKVQ